MSSACWMRSLVMTSPLEFFVSSLNQTFGWALLSARSQTLSSTAERTPREDPEPGRLFGKWCIRDDIGKVGGCVPLDISNAEIPNDVVKGGLRLPTSDVAKALFESVFKCQARKFGQDRALFVLRNSIKACPQNIHHYSRMGHSDFGLFVKSDGSRGMKRDGIPNNLHLLRRNASDALRDKSIASRTRTVSGTLIPAITIPYLSRFHIVRGRRLAFCSAAQFVLHKKRCR